MAQDNRLEPFFKTDDPSVKSDELGHIAYSNITQIGLGIEDGMDTRALMFKCFLLEGLFEHSNTELSKIKSLFPEFNITLEDYENFKRDLSAVRRLSEPG